MTAVAWGLTLLLTITFMILLFHIAVIPVLWPASLVLVLPWLWRRLSSHPPVARWSIMVLFAVAATVAFLALF